MSNVFHRVPNRKIPIAVRGEGMHIIDSEGKRYIDAYAGGACVSCLGHSHSAVIEAVQNQISTFAYCHAAAYLSRVICSFYFVYLKAGIGIYMPHPLSLLFKSPNTTHQTHMGGLQAMAKIGKIKPAFK